MIKISNNANTAHIYQNYTIAYIPATSTLGTYITGDLHAQILKSLMSADAAWKIINDAVTHFVAIDFRPNQY